jgi:hypothetical protein
VAKYTGAIYQGAYYGQAPRLVLSAEPMAAYAMDYDLVWILWNLPAGNFTKIRLVRNNDNYPETPEDGITLWEQSSTTNISGAIERDRFFDGVDNFRDASLENDYYPPTGQFVYYTMWIFTSGSLWKQAGFASTVVPKNFGTQDRLFEMLPKVYTTDDQTPTGIPNTESFVYKFLKPFSFSYDEILTYASLLKPSYGKRTTPPQLLGINQVNLGLTPESGLPNKSQKKLIRESVFLYKNKGTYLGVSGYIEALTGYAPTVTVSPNLLLDVQDSSFTNGVGRWTSRHGVLTSVSNKTAPTGNNAIDKVYSGRFVTSVSTVTLKQRTDNVARLTLSAPHGFDIGDTVNVTGVDSSFNGNGLTVLSTPTTSSFTYTNTDVNLGSTAATGSVTNTSNLFLGKDAPITKGVPVTADTAYTFSYYAASDSNGNVEGRIYWYDELGAQIGTPVIGTEFGTTGVYQRIAQSVTSPSGAVYAAFRLKFRTQNSYNIDCVQMAPTATATNYDEARGLDIFLEPRKVNILANPSFETNSTYWTTNSSATRDNTTVPPGLPGAYSLRLTGQTNFSLATNANKNPSTYKLTQGNFYTASIYMKASVNSTLTMTLVADDDDSTNVVNAQSTLELTSTWKRYSVSLYIPDDLSETGNITLGLTIAGTLSSSSVNIYVDAAQVEAGFNATDYFDGSLPQASGVFWSGTAHASYSYFYQSRTIKMARLIDSLSQWVPMGTQWRVRSFKGEEGVS